MTLKEALNYYTPILNAQFLRQEYGKVFFYPDEIDVRHNKFMVWFSTEYKFDYKPYKFGGHMITFHSEAAELKFLKEAEKQKMFEVLST